MNAIRVELRAARERQGITFDALEARCKELEYPIGRVVLSKIEGGYRPHISVPELLVLSRALNIGPDYVLAPVGKEVMVEVLPGKHLTPWHAALWLRGVHLPLGLTDNLTADGPDDQASFVRGARVLALYEEHAAKIQEWLTSEADARSLFRDRSDQLNYLAGRLQPIQTRMRDLRSECRGMGAEPPPVPFWMAAILDEPRTSPFTGYEAPEDFAASPVVGDLPTIEDIHDDL